MNYEPPSLTALAESLVAEMEDAVDIYRRPKPGGQQAGPRWSWMKIMVPSSVRQYEWWIRELKAAIARDAAKTGDRC